ncbi:unnamed protein product [Closterium sp. NIES-54]
MVSVLYSEILTPPLSCLCLPVTSLPCTSTQFTYPSSNTTVQRVERMVSMLYTPATSSPLSVFPPSHHKLVHLPQQQHHGAARGAHGEHAVHPGPWPPPSPFLCFSPPNINQFTYPSANTTVQRAGRKFTYPSANTTVQRVGRMVSMLYTPATSFYHSMIEWVPQWLVLRELLQEHPNILIVMRAAQHIVGVEPAHMKLLVLDWQHRNTLFLTQALYQGCSPYLVELTFYLIVSTKYGRVCSLVGKKGHVCYQGIYVPLSLISFSPSPSIPPSPLSSLSSPSPMLPNLQPVYRCCGRATPTIWRFLRRNFFLPPDGLPIYEPESFRLRRTSPLNYQDITDLLSQREEQQSQHPRRLDVLKPGPLPSLAETFGMTTGLNWVTILVRRPGNLSRNMEESVYERVEGWMRKEFGERRVVVFDGSLPLMEARALFRRAALLVGTHGAALTNLLFMPRGAFLLEIRPRGYPNACYHHLASVSQMHYWLLLGNGTKDSALQVDTGEVLSTIREVAGKVFAALRGESKDVGERAKRGEKEEGKRVKEGSIAGAKSGGKEIGSSGGAVGTSTAAVTVATAATADGNTTPSDATGTAATTHPISTGSSTPTPSLSSPLIPSSTPIPTSLPTHTTTPSAPPSLTPILPLPPPTFPIPLSTSPSALPATFPSGCACYRLRNAFCCTQAVCVCRNVCYNGSALLGRYGPDISDTTDTTDTTDSTSSTSSTAFPPRPPHPCLPPVHAPATANKSALLSPTSCSNLPQFGRMLRSALSEAPVKGGLQAAGDGRWRRWVGGEAEWRMGGTLFVPLTHQTTNVAHFLGEQGMGNGWGMGRVCVFGNIRSTPLLHAPFQPASVRPHVAISAFRGTSERRAAGSRGWAVAVVGWGAGGLAHGRDSLCASDTPNDECGALSSRDSLPRVDRFLLQLPHAHITTPLPLLCRQGSTYPSCEQRKAAHILLVNNVTVKAGLPRVDRFLLPRADWTVHR